jgi:hypothetical protein
MNAIPLIDGRYKIHIQEKKNTSVKKGDAMRTNSKSQ